MHHGVTMAVLDAGSLVWLIPAEVNKSNYLKSVNRQWGRGGGEGETHILIDHFLSTSYEAARSLHMHRPPITSSFITTTNSPTPQTPFSIPQILLSSMSGRQTDTQGLPSRLNSLASVKLTALRIGLLGGKESPVCLDNP